MSSVSSAISKIKQIGTKNVSITVPNEKGLCNIIATSNDGQETIMENVASNVAEDIIKQATSNVILG